MSEAAWKPWKKSWSASRSIMDYRSVIFYVALLLIVGCVAELYVRINGMGERLEKVRGVIVSKTPKLASPILFLISAIVIAAMTIPH